MPVIPILASSLKLDILVLFDSLFLLYGVIMLLTSDFIYCICIASL